MTTGVLPQRFPLKQSDSTDDPASMVYFTVGEYDEDGEGDDDAKGLTKKDIHTLNEQRRRDIIKVGLLCYAV